MKGLRDSSKLKVESSKFGKRKDNAETPRALRFAEEEGRGNPSVRLRAGPFGNLRVNRRVRRVGSRWFTIYHNTGIVTLSIVIYIV